MMKKIYYTLLVFVGLTLLAACDKEETLEPSGANDNFFRMPDDRQDAEAALCRDFLEKNGIYLLCNDTLRKEYLGKDAYGDDRWQVELVDFDYNLTSLGDQKATYDFLETMEEKRKAAKLIEDEILPHIEGGALAPYSILLLNSLEKYSSEEWEVVPAKTINCMRCLGIAVGEWMALENEEEREAYKKEVLVDLISAKFNSSSEEADPFYEVSNEYYGEYLSEIVEDWDRNIEDVYALGFLSFTEDYWDDDPDYDYLPYDTGDFKAYFNAVMGRSEEDFVSQYGNYPVVMNKYYIIRNIIIGLGYKF